MDVNHSTLLEELEEVLGIASYPMNWPIGMGKSFEGLYDMHNKRLELYKGDERLQHLKMVMNFLLQLPILPTSFGRC